MDKLIISGSGSCTVTTEWCHAFCSWSCIRLLIPEVRVWQGTLRSKPNLHEGFGTLKGFPTALSWSYLLLAWLISVPSYLSCFHSLCSSQNVCWAFPVYNLIVQWKNCFLTHLSNGFCINKVSIWKTQAKLLLTKYTFIVQYEWQICSI